MVIGTFAAVPYVHLQLETARRLYPEVPLLIHDDASRQRSPLKSLARDYGADFASTPVRQVHHLGDLAAFSAGLRWAHERGLDLLLKVSRRWIWRRDWRPSLTRLARETEADTFSHHTESFGFGFRTECMALQVRQWWESDFAAAVTVCLQEQRHVFVENYLHRWAAQFSALGSSRWQEWQRHHPTPLERSGYAPWEFMGNCRTTPHPHRLWHDSDGPDAYAALAGSWGLPYTAADFADPNQGEGPGPVPPPPMASGAALPGLLEDLGDELVGAEIGVWLGDTTRHLLTSPRVVRLYAIDPFLSYDDWWGRIPQGLLDRHLEEVQMDLERDPRLVLLRRTSDEAAEEVEELDFVFIDGDHRYEQVGRDLRNYWQKLRPGGLFSGHDYRGLDSVREAVNEFAAELGVAVQEAPHDVWWWRKDGVRPG